MSAEQVKPIIFYGPMVKAILEGRKTQTRRVLKVQPPSVEEVRRRTGATYSWLFKYWWQPVGSGRHVVGKLMGMDRPKLAVPYDTMDVLWVRETCQAVELESGLDVVRYPADGADIAIPDTAEAAERWMQLYWYGKDKSRRVPAIHQPKWASRLTLRVNKLRVEPLQDISDKDALAEGIERQDPTADDERQHTEWCREEGFEYEPLQPVWIAPGTRQGHGARPNDPKWGPTPKHAFAQLWDSINARRAPWERNPWVVVIEFEVDRRNVDELKGRWWW